MRHGRTVVLALIALLLSADTGRAEAPGDIVAVTDERFGQPIAPIFLLPRPDVRADLQLNPRQVAGAREMAGRLADRLLAMKNRTEPASRSEMREIDEAMASWLRRELSPVQLDRLSEVSLQWEGASALRHPSVAEYLVLGKPQRHRIHELLVDRDRRQAGGALAPGEFDRISREVLAVLTPDQLTRWREMLGPPCRFTIAQHDPTTRR